MDMNEDDERAARNIAGHDRCEGPEARAEFLDLIGWTPTQLIYERIRLGRMAQPDLGADTQEPTIAPPAKLDASLIRAAPQRSPKTTPTRRRRHGRRGSRRGVRRLPLTPPRSE